MSTSEASDDPFERHRQRDPLPSAGIHIVQLTDSPGDAALAALEPLIQLIRELGRPVEWQIVPRDRNLSQALDRGLAGASLPLVLVTTAREPWTQAHLVPLLTAIDHCDHVLGRRPAGVWETSVDWLLSLPRRLLFALPLWDIHSPCRLHRRDKLRRIPLQSASSFLEVEILAKATFLGDLIDQVDVPPLDGRIWSEGSWSDWRLVLLHPHLAPNSGPAEKPQSEREGDYGPRSQDEESRADLDQSGAV
jgi:hypothetical protein